MTSFDNRKCRKPSADPSLRVGMTMQTVFDLLKRGRGDPSPTVEKRCKSVGGDLRTPRVLPQSRTATASPCGSVLSRVLMSPGHQFNTAKPQRGSLWEQRAICRVNTARYTLSVRYNRPLRLRYRHTLYARNITSHCSVESKHKRIALMLACEGWWGCG